MSGSYGFPAAIALFWKASNEWLPLREPQGILGRRHDENIMRGSTASNGLEPRIKSGMTIDRPCRCGRLIKGRLRNCVILRDKGETNLGTRLCMYVGWSIGQSVVLANSDVDDVMSCVRATRSKRFLPEDFKRMSLLWWINCEHLQ